MREYVIRKTEREGLLYAILIAAKYRSAKLINIRNAIGRSAKITEYFCGHDVIKVHFGAGSGRFGEAAETALPGFLNTDILGDIPIDITKRLPFRDQSVDLVFSSHLIEHVLRRQFRVFLRETLRVLKPRGTHIIATPSLEKVAKLVYGEPSPERQLIMNTHCVAMGLSGVTPAIVLNGYTHINYGHRFLYDFDTVRLMAEECGYILAERIDDLRSIDQEVAAFLEKKPGSYHAETEVFVLRKP